MCGVTLYMEAEALRKWVRQGEQPPWWKWGLCRACGGTGKVPLFTSLSKCDACRGAKGKWITTPLLAEMLSTLDGREAYRDYQREVHERDPRVRPAVI